MLYFIVNDRSQSGKTRKIWADISRELKAQQVAFRAYRTRGGGDAARIAGRISRMPDRDIRLVVVGGDGTINEVLNGISDFSKVKFACISAGSGNDFARGLRLSGNHLEQLRHILASGVTQQIDIGRVTYTEDGACRSRFFGISSGLGLDAIVCKKALRSKQKNFLNKIGLGKLTYVLLTVETLFAMTTVKAVIDFCNPATASHSKRDLKQPDHRFMADRVIFMAAMNMAAEGGGVPMAPAASCCDGRLSLCMAHTIPKWRTFFCMPLLMAAKHTGIRGFEVIDSDRIAVTTDRPAVLHTDGEYCGEVTRAVFECCHNQLNIIR